MTQPLIIDGNNLVRRCIAVTALDDLQAGGVWTGGVFGSLRMLRDILAMPEYAFGPVYCFFDAGIPKERMRAYPTYKSKRKQDKELIPEEDKEKAYAQLDLSREMFEILGVTCAAYQDREADDTVAAAVRILVAQGKKPIVVSGDRDLLQCVPMGAEVWNFKEMVTRDNFLEKTGVDLAFYTLYKSLISDTSDSIQGVPGCGPKRAVELIEQAFELDNQMAGERPSDQLRHLIEMVRDIPEKKRKKFQAALLEFEEVTRRVIRCIDLSNSFGKTAGLAVKLRDRNKLDRMGFLRFCKRYSFGSILGNPDHYIRPFERASSVK